MPLKKSYLFKAFQILYYIIGKLVIYLYQVWQNRGVGGRNGVIPKWRLTARVRGLKVETGCVFASYLGPFWGQGNASLVRGRRGAFKRCHTTPEG